MASLTDHVDAFLDSDLLFCTVTCSAIFLSVFLVPWLFCNDPEDGDIDQLKDEDYVYNAPFYFSLLFFCLSCFAVLLYQLRFDVAVLTWASEIPSEHWSVVGILLLVGALGLFLVVAELEKGGDATLPLAGEHLLEEQGEDASPLEIALEDSVLHCAVTFFNVAIQIPTLPFRLLKAICKPLVTYIYGPICAPGELPVSNEVYDTMVQELCKKVSELSSMWKENEELKRQAQRDRLDHESEIRIARLEYEDLELRAETDDLRHQVAMQEEMQLSSTLTRIGVGRDQQKMMAMIHRLALLNAASESDSDDTAHESASLDEESVTETAAEVVDVEQNNNDIEAAENDTMLIGELATEVSKEGPEVAVATEELEAEESDNNEMDEGDDAAIDDSVNKGQPTPLAPGEKRKKTKSKGKANKRRAGKDLQFRKEMVALGQEKDALETSWAVSRQQRAATTQAAAASTPQPAVTTVAPVQQRRPAVNTTVKVQQQPQEAPVAAANTFQLAPRIIQPTREQIWQFNGWQSYEDVRLFQPTQQHTYGQSEGQHYNPGQFSQPAQQPIHGQNAGQYEDPSQFFQPTRQQTYERDESQQQPRSQYWHELSGTERQPGQYNLFGPPFL